ncbi:hypothetical protein EC912_101786 [Luteibacter rhizovicinus]|uniref:Uncharacterized protein n=1 Tax=Luteibacter rhizovicinus TaxID=242606 RepID=A0A4V2W4Z5_9GAMM|nr:hypothetical protein EC912_101786 [Luteibacter rhizovicinus]
MDVGVRMVRQPVHDVVGRLVDELVPGDGVGIETSQSRTDLCNGFFLLDFRPAHWHRLRSK